MSRGKPCGVCARQMRSRSIVRVIRGVAVGVPCPISLRVSDAGRAATAPTPARARAITASIMPRLTNGRAASWTRTIAASAASASSPARTESIRCAPPGTNPSRSPRSFASHSGGRCACWGGSATITCRTSGWPMNARSARSSIGTPRMARNCFGSPGPARTPAPAATTTTPTSGGEAPGELTDSLQSDHLQIFAAFRSVREKYPPEALPGRFGEPALDTGDGPDLAAEPDFAEEQGVGGNRAIVHRRHERRQNREVGRRFDQPHAARDVDKHVEISEREPAAAFEHREEQRETPVIEPGRHALRRAEARLRGERLYFDEHRARAFHQRGHGGNPCARGAPGEECGGGIGDRLKPGPRHLEDADLVNRTKAIFYRAQNARIERRLAFEVESRIDAVLERLGSGDAAALGDVTDEQDRRARVFREAHETRRAFAHLPHVAGRALERFGVGRLHRVEQHNARLELRGVVHDRLEARLAENVDGARLLLQPIGAQSQLIRRFFARDVKRGDALILEPRRALHEQGRFANAGLAADQGDGAGYDTTAEDEVEFRQPGAP